MPKGTKEHQPFARAQGAGMKPRRFVLGDMGESFYKSKRWKRTRAAILARDGYQCQESKRYGKAVPANTVHHIFPISDYPQYRWELWNLISLSNDKHNEMHDRNTGELTEEGKKLQERTARKYEIEA